MKFNDLLNKILLEQAPQFDSSEEFLNFYFKDIYDPSTWRNDDETLRSLIRKKFEQHPEINKMVFPNGGEGAVSKIMTFIKQKNSPIPKLRSNMPMVPASSRSFGGLKLKPDKMMRSVQKELPADAPRKYIIPGAGVELVQLHGVRVIR